VVILLDLAIGTEVDHHSFGHALVVVVEEIGIGLVAGLADCHCRSILRLAA
jgi:hypothetical protein